MPQIFISYRRSDESWAIQCLYSQLRSEFGKEDVFIDRENILAGANFEAVINQELSDCHAMIVVIGPTWNSEENGQPRLMDPNDFVRREVESAIKRQIPIFVVLIQESGVPSKQKLPTTLHGLTNIQAISIDPGKEFDSQVDRLIKSIATHTSVAEEESVWRITSTRRRSSDFERYLKLFPEGRFATEARRGLLQSLRGELLQHPFDRSKRDRYLELRDQKYATLDRFRSTSLFQITGTLLRPFLYVFEVVVRQFLPKFNIPLLSALSLGSISLFLWAFFKYPDLFSTRALLLTSAVLSLTPVLLLVKRFFDWIHDFSKLQVAAGPLPRPYSAGVIGRSPIEIAAHFAIEPPESLLSHKRDEVPDLRPLRLLLLLFLAIWIPYTLSESTQFGATIQRASVPTNNFQSTVASDGWILSVQEDSTRLRIQAIPILNDSELTPTYELSVVCNSGRVQSSNSRLFERTEAPFELEIDGMANGEVVISLFDFQSKHLIDRVTLLRPSGGYRLALDRVGWSSEAASLLVRITVANPSDAEVCAQIVQWNASLGEFQQVGRTTNVAPGQTVASTLELPASDVISFIGPNGKKQIATRVRLFRGDEPLWLNESPSYVVETQP